MKHFQEADWEIEIFLQLAEVISEETALRQENRKMSVIIAEAQTVKHLIMTIFIITTN